VTAAPIPSRRVTPRQIADLLTQARHLSGADPAALATYLAAKTELLTAITNPDQPDHIGGHTHQEQR
jgi:hypothetical protein